MHLLETHFLDGDDKSDLKPVNIMMIPDAEGTEGERAKILDFGIAKLAADPRTRALTRVGVSMGTPAYMSPEQCRSARDVADKSDIYALGVILFEALAGEHPFSEMRADSAMMAAHISREPPRLESKAPATSAELAALIHRMLAKQPAIRPSAAELSISLARLAGFGTGARAAVAPEPPPLPPQSAAEITMPPPAREGPTSVVPAQKDRAGRLVIIGAAVALLLGVVGLVWVGRMLLHSPASSQPSTLDLAGPSHPSAQPSKLVPVEVAPRALSPQLAKEEGTRTKKSKPPKKSRRKKHQ